MGHSWAAFNSGAGGAGVAYYSGVALGGYGGVAIGIRLDGNLGTSLLDNTVNGLAPGPGGPAQGLDSEVWPGPDGLTRGIQLHETSPATIAGLLVHDLEGGPTARPWSACVYGGSLTSLTIRHLTCQGVGLGADRIAHGVQLTGGVAAPHTVLNSIVSDVSGRCLENHLLTPSVIEGFRGGFAQAA